MTFALFLLPGVGVFAQTSTQSPLAVVAANGKGLVSDLVNAATGALSQAQVIIGGPGSFQLVAAERGGVYAVENLMLNGYTIDALNGALTPIPGSPYSLPEFGSAVGVEASGRFLYVGLIPPSTQVAGYSIDSATGALTAIAASPFAVRSGSVQALVSDGAGKFLYAAGNGVSVLAIDATTGALTEIAGSPAGSGGTYNGLAMDPQKRFLFVSSNNGIAAGAIDAATGGLTPLIGQPFYPGAAIAGVSFDGSGRFLYASQSGTNLLWSFVVDATSGNLTSVPGDPFLCGPGCFAVAGDASGKYVYAGSDSVVWAYQIDGSTGALTWINGVPEPMTISGGATTTIALAPAAGSPTATLQSLQILPPNPTVDLGLIPHTMLQQFTAEGTYSDGTQRFLTSSVSWSSSNPSVATISNALGQNGLAAASVSGSTTITATLQGVTATTSLTAMQP
jgi:6-phosphogluconolactonase (cycloisomerase 2 family)